MDQIKAQGSSKGGGSADSVRDSVASSISRGKEAVGAAASDAMDTAGTDLKGLQSDLSDLKETGAKLVSRAGDEVAKSAREIAGQVSTAASDLAEKGANVASVATDQARTLVTEVENIARIDAYEREPTCTQSSGPTECAGMIRCDTRIWGDAAQSNLFPACFISHRTQSSRAEPRFSKEP